MDCDCEVSQMKSEHAREFCSMESSANSKWQEVIDMAVEDQDGWIKELEYAHRLLHALGLDYAVLLLIAADIKLTAEMYRMAAGLDDQNDENE